jgi:membrane-bound metal-dependent hydrolase YbcI (DUF457 family)
MDPITHGIAGALIGKGFFAPRHNTKTRVAILAATLGAVFPDVDTVGEAFSRDPLAIVKYHRAITHSFVALPFFAVLLAWLTRWVARRYKFEAPSWPWLSLIYGVGIASHILLDGMTSFGTRMLYPLSSRRFAWDLLFIIDLAFTAIVLLPQIVAWVYSDRERCRKRALRAWILCSLGALPGWAAAYAFGYPFHFWVVVLVSALLAVLFFGPSLGGFGFRVERAAWCQAGLFVMLLYLFACSIAHHKAILRGKAFADAHHIDANRMAALPIPPSILDWGDAIRTPDGLYQSRFDFRDPHPPNFTYIPDSPPDIYIARAFDLANVRLYWQFARFPSIHSFPAGSDQIVELGENRFSDGRRGPQPFTYEVIFSRAGQLLAQGWVRSGIGAVGGDEIPQHTASPTTVTGPAGAAH